MLRSRLAAATVLALVAPAAPAFAAKAKPKPKPICLLVKDAQGDAGFNNNSGGAATYDPSLDIVSADIGVSATMLTAVIRVKDLTKEDNLAPTGRTWSISMSNGTGTLGLSAYLSKQAGERFSSDKGVFDYDHDEIRIHAPLSEYPNAKIKKGAIIRGFYLKSNQIVGLDPAWQAGYAFSPFASAADATDTSTASFPVGALSCVKVGA